MPLQIRSNAKINWSLYVTGKRPDGYHLLDMVLQSVDISDVLLLRKHDRIELTSDSPELPTDQRNIVWKAAQLFFSTYGISSGVKMEIQKQIPMEAGMAGGSADAAAVLRGLYMLYDIIENDEAKRELALKLGADVPFMLTGGLARVRGIGEELDFYSVSRQYSLVILKPSQGASTQKVFKAFVPHGKIEGQDNTELLRALSTGDLQGIAEGMHNDLEATTTALVPEIARAIQELKQCGAIASVMTGSGSAVIGLFEDKNHAERAYIKLKDRFYYCATASTVSRGLEV